MKKYWIYAVLIALITCPVFAELVGTLEDVMKPSMITVKNNEIYVGQGAEFSVFSLDKLELLRKFGKRGEGPGELVVIPHFPNKITVAKNQVFVTGIGKAISFSKEGKFLNEFRTHQRIVQLFPAGDNLVAMEQMTGKDKIAYMVINLYSKKIKKIKELYRQKWVRQGGRGALKLDMGFDFLCIAVADDKIYIEKSAEGFLIDVFDSKGKKLYGIQKEYEKTPITSAEKERIENFLRQDPAIQQDLKQLGGWNEFKKFLKFEYPDHYAPIKGIEVSNNKIYVRTFISKNDKEKYIVMDLKGKILNTTWISRDLEVSILAQIAGAKLYSIDNNKLYFIKENPDTEDWELFAEPLK